MWRVYAYGALLVACCGYALLRGGGPERAAALVVLCGSLLSPLAAPDGTDFQSLPLGLFAIDMLDQIGLLLIALRANRCWPLAAAAIHWISPMSSVARVLLPPIAPIVYFFAEQTSFYLILILLAIGTWRHRWRLVRFGNDPSWTTFCATPAFDPLRRSPID